ncbi:MAG: hypothetical protein IKG90_06030 [Bacteroidales bacterium]|nr:hypothetical protein [Bacteroidales bacterium]
MKKVLFSFAVVAACLFVTACGKKAQQENSENEAVEQVAEAEAQEPKLPVGPCTIEMDMMSVDIPEGWEVLKQDRHEVKIYPGTGDQFTESILIQEQPYRALADAVKTMKGLEQTKDLGTLPFGDNKFLAYEMPGGLTVLMRANDKDEYVQAEVRSEAYKKDGYKQVLAGIKLK